MSVEGRELAMTTDSFVVKPLRFPGGSIGELAVNGTVNDLAVSGARPLALTVSMILEEGLDADVLRAEVQAIAGGRRGAGVEIVAGDTKVVERGAADQMYLCTTGIGVVDPRAVLAPAAIMPGDQVLVSGPIGEHGTAIMLARNEFDLDADDRIGHVLVVAGRRRAARMRAAARAALHARRDARRRRVGAQRARALRGRRRSRSMRRTSRSRRSSRRRRSCSGSIRCTWPTRAGWSRSSRRKPPMQALERAAGPFPAASRRRVIGEVRREPPGMVLVETSFGGRRVMDQLVGDPLPRIC